MIFRSLLIYIEIAALTLPLLVQGQSNYSGKFKLGSLSGQAEFTYQIEGRDTILQGPFQLEHSDLETLEGRDNYFSLRGNYQKDIPDDHWILEFGQLTPTGSVRLKDHHYQMSLDGVLHKAEGVLRQGRYQGKWIHTVNDIQNSEPGSPIFRSEAQFEAGIPQQAIQIEYHDNVLLGRFLRSGLAHDEWTLYNNKQESESWHFTDGRLDKIVLPAAQGSMELPVFPKSDEGTQIVNLDERFLSLVDLRMKISGYDYSFLNGKAAQLLIQNCRYYEKVQAVLLSREAYDIPAPFQVEVPYHPFTEQQNKDISQIRSDISLIDSLNQWASSNSSINIAKVTDADISYWQATIEALSQTGIKSLRTLVQYHDLKTLDFVDKGSLWAYLWPSMEMSSALNVQFEMLGNKITRTYSMVTPETSAIRAGETSSLVNISGSFVSQIDSIITLIKSKVQSGENNDQLVEIEEQLIDTVRILNQLLDSAHSTGLATEALDKLQDQATKELSKYSTVVDIEAKQIQAANALRCLTHFNELARQIDLLPTQWELIQVEYTDKVWNNFTSTVMSEDVKRRITGSYRDILIPHFLQMIVDDLSCVNSQQLGDGLKQLYERMFELRHQDTTKLERKLRRETDANAILSLFSMDPIISEKS